MTSPMTQHGAFSWAELMTSDVDAAKAYYSSLLGWKMEDMQVGDMTYTVISAGEKEMAGMMTTPPEAADMPPMWGAYVTVDDVDARAKQAESLGGKVLVEPRDIPDVGRFCVVQDPQGAVLSLITYLEKAVM